MERQTDDGVASITTRFASDPTILLSANDISEFLEEAQAKLIKRVEDFIQMGSGWVLIKVENVKIHTATFNPIGASSYIATPEKISNTKAVLNIKNTDDECFV